MQLFTNKLFSLVPSRGVSRPDKEKSIIAQEKDSQLECSLPTITFTDPKQMNS